MINFHEINEKTNWTEFKTELTKASPDEIDQALVIQRENGWTGLHMAAPYLPPELFSILMEKASREVLQRLSVKTTREKVQPLDPDYVDYSLWKPVWGWDNWTVLSLIAKYQNDDCLTSFLRKVDTNIIDRTLNLIVTFQTGDFLKQNTAYGFLLKRKLNYLENLSTSQADEAQSILKRIEEASSKFFDSKKIINVCDIQVPPKIETLDLLLFQGFIVKKTNLKNIDNICNTLIKARKNTNPSSLVFARLTRMFQRCFKPEEIEDFNRLLNIINTSNDQNSCADALQEYFQSKQSGFFLSGYFKERNQLQKDAHTYYSLSQGYQTFLLFLDANKKDGDLLLREERLIDQLLPPTPDYLKENSSYHYAINQTLFGKKPAIEMEMSEIKSPQSRV